MYIDEAIKKYVDDLAARLPAPGGGSAAGLSGALGTALLEMVCNFTVGKEKYKAVEQDMGSHLASLKKIREEFMALIDEDVRAYSTIRDAFKGKDKKVIDKALKDGYYISLKSCGLSKSGMQIAVELPERSNPNLITDVGCGAELLSASFNSSIYNAEINLKSIEDKEFTAKEKEVLETLKKKIQELYREATLKTKKRME